MLIEKVKSFVIELLSNQLPFENYYHNLTHTKSVVETAILLAKKDNCTEEEAILVQIAAWFHDVGYIEIDEGHEEVSKKIAANFLEENGFNNEDLKIILQLIDVTKINSIPTTSLEKIIKDADCGHVISEDFLKVSEKLRIELNCKKECNINEIKWLKETQSFLEKAQFYTEYAKENWQTLKEINQYKVQQKIDKLILKSKEKKNIKVGRGVETLFRVQLKNHIELSSIADTKANILLSVNAIIISVTLSSLIPKLDSPSNMFLVTPTLILTIFSVASIVLSVLSTRPKISNVKVTQEMIKNKQTFCSLETFIKCQLQNLNGELIILLKMKMFYTIL